MYLRTPILPHRNNDSLSTDEGSDFEESLRPNTKKRVAKRPLKSTPVSQSVLFCFVLEPALGSGTRKPRRDSGDMFDKT